MNRDFIIAAIVVLCGIVIATVLVIRDNPPLVLSSVPPPPVIESSPMVRQTPVNPPPPATRADFGGARMTRSPQGRTFPTRRSGRAPIYRGPVAAQPQEMSVTEPVARESLARIGVDPGADAAWIKAINDPNLSANARRNLIEDLNETGFANPRNLSVNDLPMIEYRLALIEQLAGDAMDDVNYAAFEEAYKDLIEMYARATGQ